MKSLYCIFLLALMLSSCTDPVIEEIHSDITVIPAPQELTIFTGVFEMTAATSILADHELAEEAEQLRAYLLPATGYPFPVNKRRIWKGNAIALKLTDNMPDLGEEGYELEITGRKVKITAGSPTGIIWGIQTLRQLLPVEILREAVVDDVNWAIPKVHIIDKPRFTWRGLMIDYSRTFWNISHTKKYIDALSYYKMNKLHMHLTDDQGWRIEILKYPALTEIASKFDTVYHELPEREGYYAQEDIRELIKYAEARNVELIPEIEMPGHTTEVFAAFPELSCSGDTLSIHPFFKGPGIHQEIFCAGKEESFKFLKDVLSEVSDLFPSKYIHIGGDEAPKAMWQVCPDCQNIIREKGLKNEDELQSWFIKQIEEYIDSKGKKLIGWDEIIEGGLGKTATMMFWRGWMEEAPVIAINQGNDVIMTPTSHCYFDYTYEKISTEKVYSFEPVPDKINAADSDHVLGVQANFWSHIDRTEPTMDRQVFPRLIALAEVGWTEAMNKDWEDFSARLEHHFKSLTLLDIYYMNE
jgi:hexosaminidase